MGGTNWLSGLDGSSVLFPTFQLIYWRYVGVFGPGNHVALSFQNRWFRLRVDVAFSGIRWIVSLLEFQFHSVPHVSERFLSRVERIG